MQEDSWRIYSSSEGIPSITQNSWRRIHPSVRFKCQHNKGTPLPAPPALQICHAGKEKLHREQQLFATSTVHRPSLAITPNKKCWGLFLERADRGTWKNTASSLRIPRYSSKEGCGHKESFVWNHLRALQGYI